MAIVFIVISIIIIVGLVILVPRRKEYWGTGKGGEKGEDGAPQGSG